MSAKTFVVSPEIRARSRAVTLVWMERRRHERHHMVECGACLFGREKMVEMPCIPKYEVRIFPPENDSLKDNLLYI